MSFFLSKSHYGGNATSAGIALFVAFSRAWAVDWTAPPDPLVLPAPREKHVEFVPVFLHADDPVHGTAKFVMGMGGQSINESPTEVEVGGSFRATRDGAVDWFFYMAKAEVTADLFNAVMRSAGQPAKQFSGAGDLPAVGLTYLEVQKFLDAYNRWLSNKAGDVLPADEDGLKAFLRLPTEQEWEFAARGGRKVSADEFSRKAPYGEGPLEEFEWFGGPSSSHNELQPAGKLKPNPLGLHDMLGNASEMTGTHFQLKAGQGQTGGLVKRGGNFRTRPEDLRSSLRGEFAPYDMSGDNKGVLDLGFRLVLAAPIFTDIVRVGELEELLEEQVQASPTPAAASPPMGTARIKVPFGMKWGEPVARIKHHVTKARAKVAEERTAGPREVLVVTGIVQEGLKRTLFYFTAGGLSQVQLQYDREGWSDEKVAAWVATIKREADKKYGPGRLVADENRDDGGTWRSRKGWMWTQDTTSLSLVHYTTRRANEQKIRRVILQYRAE